MHPDSFVNKEKLERAQVEAATSGESVKDIYIRIGGKFVEVEAVSDVKPAKKPAAKAAKKVAKKK